MDAHQITFLKGAVDVATINCPGYAQLKLAVLLNNQSKVTLQPYGFSDHVTTE